MKIGKIIHYYRKNNNMTQEELAFRIGVSGTSISKWENDLSYPETSLIPKIADIFGISINQLFDNDSVLASIIHEIIEDANDFEKYNLENSIIYLEENLLKYPDNENLKFEIARRYYLFSSESPEKAAKELTNKASIIFNELIKSSSKDISQWSIHFLSMIFSKQGKVNQALALNKQLMLPEGLNPKLDKIAIKLFNDYVDIDKDININLISLMQEYYLNWKYLYKYHYNMEMYPFIIREGLKYISIINNFIGKDDSILFKQLCFVYYDLGIAYYKVNNKMRSDECFISSLLYAKKFDELDKELIAKQKVIVISSERKVKTKRFKEIKSLIKNNDELEIKGKLDY